MVNVVGRLIDGVKAKGSATAIDVSDIAQRESFDVIGMVKPPCWRTINMLSDCFRNLLHVACMPIQLGKDTQGVPASQARMVLDVPAMCKQAYVCTGGLWQGLSGEQKH